MRSFFDYAAPIPRLSDRELEILLAHVTSSRDLFEIANAHLEPDDFDESQLKYSALWASVLDIVDEHGLSLPCTTLRTMVEADLNARIEGDPDALLEEEIDDLLGRNAWMSEDETASILGRVFDVEPSELDAALGLELLKRFVHERTIVASLREFFGRGESRTVDDVQKMIEEADKRISEVQEFGSKATKSVAERWQGHLQRLEKFRGRTLIGLSTGMPWLDECTLGIRGFFLLGAPPGVGKTALAMELGLGVCRWHELNDAVVVIVSLEMSADDLMTRIDSNLGEIDYATLMFGSSGLRNGPPWFNSRDQAKLEQATRQIHDNQIGRRLLILERADLGENITARRLHSIVRKFKNSVGASKALLIFDYLQLLPLPSEIGGGSDLEADRYRIRVVQDFVAFSKTAENPEGDPVIAISESRKPPTAKEEWGQSIADLMGSARLGYAPDAVLLYRKMTKGDFNRYAYAMEEALAEQRREELEATGIIPIVLTLAKGRDGMTRREWPMEFHYRQSRFEEFSLGRDSHPELHFTDSAVAPAAPSAAIAMLEEPTPRRRLQAREC